MKAARIHKHGGREVLRVEDIPAPELHTGQVCIKLKTSALNHLDIWVREGIPGVPLPLIMGSDGAGEICKLGEKADKFSIGDPVIIQPLVYCDECRNCQAGNENLCEKMGIRGESTNGTNCEFIVLDEKFVESKPDNISFAEAAAFPLVGQTAYQMLVNRAKIQPGENVLVWGAGSGVGHMAVQIAKIVGCNVIATAGTDEKCSFANELGADKVVNHYSDNVAQIIKTFCGKVDVVFEHVGSATWAVSMNVLNKGGRVVTCGATTGPKAVIDLRHLFFKQQTILGSTMGNADAFSQVIKLVADGHLIPRVDKIFSLDDIAIGHEYLEHSEQFGKVIIDI
jgi:NADPH:quinone reductase-like Zn-dependent oxidoreductase